MHNNQLLTTMQYNQLAMPSQDATNGQLAMYDNEHTNAVLQLKLLAVKHNEHVTITTLQPYGQLAVHNNEHLTAVQDSTVKLSRKIQAKFKLLAVEDPALIMYKTDTQLSMHSQLLPVQHHLMSVQLNTTLQPNRQLTMHNDQHAAVENPTLPMQNN